MCLSQIYPILVIGRERSTTHLPQGDCAGWAWQCTLILLRCWYICVCRRHRIVSFTLQSDSIYTDHVIEGRCHRCTLYLGRSPSLEQDLSPLPWDLHSVKWPYAIPRAFLLLYLHASVGWNYWLQWHVFIHIDYQLTVC